MEKFIFTFLLVTSFANLFSQVVTPFTVRKTITQKGGIIYLSNTSSKAIVGGGKTQAQVDAAQAETPPTGTGVDNNFVNAYVDIDGDATTFMSSSDSLALPSCSEISWVGLYWGAYNTSAGSNWTKRFIRKMHQKNLQVFVWTVNSNRSMKRCLKKGVDGIITNHPEKLSELITGKIHRLL